jgi:hypothetical protein
VTAIPRLLGGVFGEFPLDLPELGEQPGDDRPSLTVFGDLGCVAQAQAMGVFGGGIPDRVIGPSAAPGGAGAQDIP